MVYKVFKNAFNKDLSEYEEYQYINTFTDFDKMFEYLKNIKTNNLSLFFNVYIWNNDKLEDFEKEWTGSLTNDIANELKILINDYSSANTKIIQLVEPEHYYPLYEVFIENY